MDVKENGYLSYINHILINHDEISKDVLFLQKNDGINKSSVAENGDRERAGD